MSRHQPKLRDLLRNYKKCRSETALRRTHTEALAIFRKMADQTYTKSVAKTGSRG